MFLFRPFGEGDPQGGGGIPPQSGPAKLQNFVGDTWGGEPAGWRGYSAPVGRGYHHPPRRFAPPLRGRGIFRPFGEGNPQGGGGIKSSPSPPQEGNYA